MNPTLRSAVRAAIPAALALPVIVFAQGTTAVVKVDPTGVSIASPDNSNVVRLRGTLHFDRRSFLDDTTPDTEDTFLLRRVRPTLEGTLNGIYDFRFMPDFGDGRTIIVDAFAVARFRPWLHLTAGKFKVPVGLERLQSANDIRFIERGFPTSLVPNRDLGVSISGALGEAAWSYSVGYFNGVTDGSSSDSNAEPDVENDANGDWAARVFVHPFAKARHSALHGFGIGIAATYGDTAGDATTSLLPSYRTPGQQRFFSYRGTSAASATFADGERLRIAPQFYYYVGRFGVLGEYTQVEQEVSRNTAAALRTDNLVHTAWQLQFSWFITGERESFRGFTPLKTVSLDNGAWGAFEVVARVQALDLDDDAFISGVDSFADPAAAASKAQSYGIGLNWYFNQNFKWLLSYDVTRFHGGSSAGDRGDEQALFTRFAVVF